MNRQYKPITEQPYVSSAQFMLLLQESYYNLYQHIIVSVFNTSSKGDCAYQSAMFLKFLMKDESKVSQYVDPSVDTWYHRAFLADVVKKICENHKLLNWFDDNIKHLRFNYPNE